MAETKYRYRLPPCPAYDIPAMESWLEDLAAKGLHLSRDGFFGPLVTFEEGPPRREKFRLEPTTTNKGLFSEEYEPNPDTLELHRQMGWTYRARRDQFHIYSSDDPNAPELNTDPQVQAITMAALTKFLWKSLRSTLVLMLFYAFLYSGNLVITGTILIGSWRAALLVGLLLWDLGRQLRAITVLTRYRKQLQNGEPLPHRSDYRRTNRRYLASSAVRKALWAFLLISFLAFLLPMLADEHYVPLEDQDLPFATLEDLYPSAEVKRMNGILESKVYGWSDFLAPQSYDMTEYAEVTFEGKTFDCYLTVQYFQTRWDWTARILAKELVSQSGANAVDQTFSKLFGDDPVIVTELVLPDADYAVYFFRNRDEPTLVIQEGCTVLRVNLDVLGSRHGFTPEELAQIFLSQFQ